jgi:hypothetical protein
MKLGMLAYYHNKVQKFDKGHHSESYVIGVMPLDNIEVL